MSEKTVETPFPINSVNGRYFIYDVDIVSYIRREHHICGVLVGTMPHLATQNVFLGLPLELMPEEARLLMERNIAYIVDDVQVHKEILFGMSAAELEVFKAVMENQGLEVARNSESNANKKRKKHMERRNRKSRETSGSSDLIDISEDPEEAPDTDKSELLFEPSEALPRNHTGTTIKPFGITPTTSYPPAIRPAPESSASLPTVPSSYPLFAYLHSKGYFMNPGLRFGCQYSVYPGDPLRFHSHFLAIGKEWDEEFNLFDIVGGGRLGTSVKKSYMIGGMNPEKGKSKVTEEPTGSENPDANDANMRTFCIEWAGM